MRTASHIPLIGAWVFSLICANTVVFAVENGAPAPDPVALRGAIEHQLREAEPTFRLNVDCTDDRGIRSLELYPGGAAVWGGKRQFNTSEGKRRELLTMLLDQGFTEFLPLYGAIRKADKAEAPLRVYCRIALRIDGLEKQSAQAADGRQHEPLLRLAASLLDQVQDQASTGSTVANLSEALSGLARGNIAPELLTLRLLYLPEDASTLTGEIVRIEDGRASRQSYAPGRVLSAPDYSRLDPAALAGIARTILESGFVSWPINVYGSGTTELHIAVLGHDRTVSARSFSRASPEEWSDEGRALQKLATEISDTVSLETGKPRSD